MDYSFEEVTIEKLVNWLNNDKIDLNPSYQRNFIWSTKDQNELIDTILKGFPLPNFFIYQKPSGNFDMVDGQQRTTTIYSFINGEISSSKNSGKKKINEVRSEFLNYKLPIIFIKNVQDEKLLNDFYVLINKKGKQLNTPEVNKSEHYDKNFLKLANEVLIYQKFIDLNLFTESSSKRMNDRAFVEELLGYLKMGIKEKKYPVNTLYEEDISDEEYIELKNQFHKVIDIIHDFNEITPINKTRYKQKNDFFTLFTFVDENNNLNKDTLLYQYKILLLIDGKDQEGRQFIRPTNEDCPPLREYANNCVSQSNSKNARLNRLKFFNSILKNRDINKNETYQSVLEYLISIFGESKIDLKKIDEYELIDLNLFENV